MQRALGNTLEEVMDRELLTENSEYTAIELNTIIFLILFFIFMEAEEKL